MRIASLDIGTNSVLLLIADVNNSNIIPIREEIAIPQLGADIINNDIISDESINRAEIVFSNFQQIIKHYNVDIIIANGTEVFRRVKNSEKVIERLSNVLGTQINIISSQKEAYLSFLGVIPDDKLWTVIDIGGGSTEVITGTTVEIHSSISLPIGSLVLKNQFFQSEIPNVIEILQAQKYIREIINIQIEDTTNTNLIGIGGTITSLAMIALGMKEFNAEVIDDYVFHYNINLKQTEILSQISAEKISLKYNIHPKRAEVLFPGALIFLLLQEKFGKIDFKISSKGLRFGAIKEFILKNI